MSSVVTSTMPPACAGYYDKSHDLEVELGRP